MSIGHKSEDVRAYYNQEYYRGATANKSTTAHFKRLAERLEIGRNDSVLDVGCGGGAWLLAASGKGARASGIDLSDVAIGNAREALPEADLRQGNAENLPWADDSFDIVSCLGSLEHFLDKPRALNEMRRVAKADARILILVPNADFLTRRLGLYGGTQQNKVVEDVMTLPQWQELFETAGLSVDERWRDLHVMSRGWIARGPVWRWLPRASQACLLAVWPLKWQYQVYHLCSVRN